MPPLPFNPCDLPDADERIPAKIWELLRRNLQFRDAEQRLRELEDKAASELAQTGNAHGPSWLESCGLVETATERNPFARAALLWLVPDPLFRVRRVAYALDEHGKEDHSAPHQLLQLGEGTTPDMNDQSRWRWWKSDSEANRAGGHIWVRGPELLWTTGKGQRLCDKVNPLVEWSAYRWPFTTDRVWNDAPLGFRREFAFIWRSEFDSRPVNPISKQRFDSPYPHETRFFKDWDLAQFRKSGTANISTDELAKVNESRDLRDKYRVLAVPAQLLTRQAAKAAFDQIYRQLAKELPDHRHFFGTPQQWRDFLSVDQLRNAGEATTKAAIQSHLRQNYGKKTAPFRERCQAYETDITYRVAYIEKLRDLIFPGFRLSELLQPLKHRRSKR